MSGRFGCHVFVLRSSDSFGVEKKNRKPTPARSLFCAPSSCCGCTLRVHCPSRTTAGKMSSAGRLSLLLFPSFVPHTCTQTCTLTCSTASPSVQAVRKKKGRGRGRCTCGEEEDGHGAVVLPLGPPAQRDQSHQEGQQGGPGPGAQQHQGGDLPVCGGGGGGGEEEEEDSG